MRTHLLHAIYPPPALDAAAPDTGHAANDAEFAPPTSPAVSRPTASTPNDPPPAIRDDRYDLGGYAGI
jgi:hypothetical protein